MLHSSDEKVFRVLELTCYWALVVTVPVARAFRRSDADYFMPIMFVGLGAAALAFVTRFFIYARPEQVWDRTRAESVRLSRTTKITLVVGYAMSGPMFVLGCVGLFEPALMGRVITALSPMRFLLS